MQAGEEGEDGGCSESKETRGGEKVRPRAQE